MINANSNVKVVVRLRPLSSKEKLEGSSECLFCHSDGPKISIGTERVFVYDQVYATEADQNIVFTESILPLVEDFIKGYNVTIFAYGQTGSGKTFTMGTNFEGTAFQSSEHGIIPRAVDAIFNSLNPSDNPKLTVSFIELYNEDIVDLLNSSDHVKNSLNIREDTLGEIYIAGVKQEESCSPEDTLDFLKKGTLCRSTGSTDMNMISSRSHAIFTMFLKQEKALKENGPKQSIISKFHFVDLAGSERLKRTNATGERAKESISINSGLLALGNVISSLADKKTKHIPYRDSKLTRLLQDSLGGNSKTLMIACVSPADINYAETLNTLRYADRARSISNRSMVNVSHNGNPAAEISELKRQIATLKQELLLVRGMGSFKSTPCSNQIPSSAMNELSDVRNQNYDLVAKIKLVTSQKNAVEKERDELQYYLLQSKDPISRKLSRETSDHLQTIANLREQISELQLSQSNSIIVNDPTPTLSQNSARLDKAKDLVRSQIISLGKLKKSGFKQNINLNEEIQSLETDISIKEELISKIEKLNKENSLNRCKYEEKIKVLHQSLLQCQKERDQALKSPAIRNEIPKITRDKYEHKIKYLGKELNDLKTQYSDLLKNYRAKSSNSEQTIKTLKSNVLTLKSERTKNLYKLEDEISRLKVLLNQKENELKDFKSKEYKALESAKKWKRHAEFQKNLLQRKSEQLLYAKSRLRTFMGLSKRRKTTLFSPGLTETPSSMWKVTSSPSSSSFSSSSSSLPKKETLEEINMFLDNNSNRNTPISTKLQIARNFMNRNLYSSNDPKTVLLNILEVTLSMNPTEIRSFIEKIITETNASIPGTFKTPSSSSLATDSMSMLEYSSSEDEYDSNKK